VGGAEEEVLDGACVGGDRLRVGGVDAREPLALLGLVKDHAGGAGEDVDEVDGRHVGGQQADLLGSLDQRHQGGVERLHVAIHHPAHARPAALSLVVHEPHELRVAGHELHVGADQQPQSLAVVGRARVGQHVVEAAAQHSEGTVHGGPPELGLAAEVVLEQPQRHAGPGRDVARGGAVEAVLRERLEGRAEDPLRGIAVGLGRRRPRHHRRDLHLINRPSRLYA
jgi:hypothetical protein